LPIQAEKEKKRGFGKTRKKEKGLHLKMEGCDRKREKKEKGKKNRRKRRRKKEVLILSALEKETGDFCKKQQFWIHRVKKKRSAVSLCTKAGKRKKEKRIVE